VWFLKNKSNKFNVEKRCSLEKISVAGAWL